MRFFCERTPWWGIGLAYVPSAADTDAANEQHGDLQVFIGCWVLGVEWRSK